MTTSFKWTPLYGITNPHFFVHHAPAVCKSRQTFMHMVRDICKYVHIRNHKMCGVLQAWQGKQNDTCGGKQYQAVLQLCRPTFRFGVLGTDCKPTLRT